MCYVMYIFVQIQKIFGVNVPTETRIKVVYGDCSYSHSAAVELSNQFRQGREFTKDLTCLGHARVAASDETKR